MATQGQLKLEQRLTDIERRLSNLENTGGQVIPIGQTLPIINLLENRNEQEPQSAQSAGTDDDEADHARDRIAVGQARTGDDAEPVPGARPPRVEQEASAQGRGEQDKPVRRRGRPRLHPKT